MKFLFVRVFNLIRIYAHSWDVELNTNVTELMLNRSKMYLMTLYVVKSSFHLSSVERKRSYHPYWTDIEKPINQSQNSTEPKTSSKRGKTRARKSRLVLVLHLSGTSSKANVDTKLKTALLVKIIIAVL